jgi:hypothetical protein
MRILFCTALAIVCLGLLGCGAGSTDVTKDQEAVFRNPSKEIPPDVQKKMAEAAAHRGGPGTTPGGTPAPSGPPPGVIPGH